MKGGTGVFIDNKNMEANFFEFLEHSEITYLSKGGFGIVLKAKIVDNNYVSKYKNIDSVKYGTPVDTLILKINFFGYNPNVRKPEKLIRPISKDDFIREVNIQTEVFLKTMNTLQPLCPAIVYSKMFEPDELSGLQTIINKLSSADDQSNKIKIILTKLMNSLTGYSIIGMELLSNYQTVDSIVNSFGENKLYDSMVLYALIELALKTGYSHGDFHYGNMMINPNDTSYFKGIQGSVIMLDFGLSVKISNEKMALIRTNYEQNNFKEILNILCRIPRYDGEKIINFPNSYTLCKFDPDVAVMNDLFIKKEEATDDIIELFNSKSKEERQQYPLLPLSNSIKNRMYPGLIDNETVDVELITLNIEPPKNVILRNWNILNDWIATTVYSLSKKHIDNTQINQVVKWTFDSIYLTSYLMNYTQDFLDKKPFNWPV